MRQTTTIEWVPVAEGLPERTDRYMVTTKYGEVLRATWSRVFGLFWNNDEDLTPNIIAWAPLPDPYRAEEEGNND